MQAVTNGPVTLVVAGQTMVFASLDAAMVQVVAEHARYLAAKQGHRVALIRLGQWLLQVKVAAGHGGFYPVLKRHSIPPRSASRAMEAARNENNKIIGQSYAATIGRAEGVSTLKSAKLADLKSKYANLRIYGALQQIANAFGAFTVFAPNLAAMTPEQRRWQEKAVGALHKCQDWDTDDVRRIEVLQLMNERMGDLIRKAPPGALPAWVSKVQRWLLSAINVARDEADRRAAVWNDGQNIKQPWETDDDELDDDNAPVVAVAAGSPAGDDLDADDDDVPGVPHALGVAGGDCGGGDGDGVDAGGGDDGGDGGGEVKALNTLSPKLLPGGGGMSPPAGGGEKKQPKAVQLTFAAEYQAAMQRAVGQLMATVEMVKSLELSEHAAVELLAEIEHAVAKARAA